MAFGEQRRSIIHVRGRIGENIPNTDGSGGSAGFIPPGSVGALSVGVADDDKVTVTGPLWSRAELEGVPLDAGPYGFFSGVFDRDGALVGTNADGGMRVARIGSVGSAFWDGASLFLMDDQGSVLSSFAPGGELLDTVPVELARGDNLLFAASFLGRIDLGRRVQVQDRTAAGAHQRSLVDRGQKTGAE